MAGIKAGLAALAFTAVWWQLGRVPAAGPLTATCIGGVWALALAARLIWQLSAIIAASVLFHGATVTLLVVAWRDVESRSAGHLREHHGQRPAERHGAGQGADHRLAGRTIHPAADQPVDQEIRDDHHGNDQQEEQVLERQRYG